MRNPLTNSIRRSTRALWRQNEDDASNPFLPEWQRQMACDSIAKRDGSNGWKLSMILYSYYRSTSSYRVRIALELKGLEYEIHPVSLVANGGGHRQQRYMPLNPQGRGPML